MRLPHQTWHLRRVVLDQDIGQKTTWEHGLDTWILFIDLVKAFDRVPRCATKKPPVETEAAAEAASDVEIGMLWRVLLKFGVPPKLVRMLISMHETVTVKFDVDGVVTTLLSIIGVKQGDLLGPELFDFYIAAVMETWRTTHSYEVCAFRTRDDFIGEQSHPCSPPSPSPGLRMLISHERRAWPRAA